MTDIYYALFYCRNELYNNTGHTNRDVGIRLKKTKENGRIVETIYFIIKERENAYLNRPIIKSIFERCKKKFKDDYIQFVLLDEEVENQLSPTY